MPKRQGPLDFPLLITVVMICAFGLVMVFSASYYYAQSRNMDNGFYYLKNQSIYFALGFALMLVLSFVDYHALEKLKTLALIVIIALMAVSYTHLTLPTIRRPLCQNGLS